MLDVVLLINYVLGNDTAYVDVNDDGTINVLDVVFMVNIILGNV